MGRRKKASPRAMPVLALCEAAKHGRVDELRDLLASASPRDVNGSVSKHGYRPLHYGAGSTRR